MKSRSVRRILVWVLTLVLIASFFMPADIVSAAENPGNTYYLATDGSDSNPGTKDAPFATINYAYSMLASGDTLFIREGTYKGFLQVISKENVTIKNYDGEKVVVQDGSVNVGYLGYVGQSSNVIISGIKFAFTDAGIQGNEIFVDNSRNVKITNCELVRGEGGIVARQGTDGLEVSGCRIHGMSWPYGGILLYTATNSKIFNNVFYDSYFGVNTYGGTTTGNQVYNNTFSKCEVDIGGANISGAPHGNIFMNNIFSSNIQNQNHDNPDALIDDFMTTNTFDYNCYNSVTMASGVVTNEGLALQQLQDKGVEQNGYMGDPRFLNAEEYELQIGRGSDCKGRATDQYLPAEDLTGQARTSPADTGAYVYVDRTNYYVAPNGDDAKAGTDAEPFKTIAHALSVMQTEDYLFLKAGNYDEAVSISGLSGITIKNYKYDIPVITKNITVTNSQNIAIGGFALTGAVTVNNSTGVKVSNADIAGQVVVVPGDGEYTDNYEISSCYIHDFQGEGAILIYNGKNGSIFNNVIYNNKNQGLLLEGGNCTNNNIYNNTLYNNGADVLLVRAPSLGNPSFNTFKNNIFSNSLQFGDKEFLKNHVFDYNCYNAATTMPEYIGFANIYDDAGNYSSQIWPTLAEFQALGQEAQGFIGDPGFLNVSNNDFRLAKTSDCIGKGTLTCAPAYDILGFKRSELVDVGANKYTGAVCDFYIAETGSDTNAGTIDAPFKTIQHGIDLLGSGATLFIKGGTYNESLAISGKTGNESSYYSLKSVPGEQVILSPGNQKETALSIDKASSFWKIDGLNIQGYTTNGIEVKGGSGNIRMSNISVSNIGGNGISGDNSSNVTLENIKVSGAKNGVAITASTGWTISRSMFGSASEAAVSLNGSNSNKVTGSIFTSNKIGMDITNSNSLVVYNNDFYGSSQSDMKLDQNSTGSVIKNNIFGSANVVSSLEIADIDNDLDYNCYSKAGDAVSYTSMLSFDDFKALGKEANGIQADPMFTDPESGNFLLKAHSPCADKGITDSNIPGMGCDGISFEAPMDIGAIFSPFSLMEYYVAADGDDNNDGSFERPWKTIEKGMNSIKQSDTLYIRGGVYNERINMYNKQGRPYAYFTVKNYNNEEVVLNSEFSQDVGIRFGNCAYWKIDGLKFTKYTGAALWATEGSKYIIMENLEIWDIDNPKPHTSGTEGILGDASYITVRKCYIHDIGQTMMSAFDNGTYIGYGAHHWIFDSNRIDNAPGSGFNFYGKPSGGDDCIVINNVVTNCRYGMVLDLGKRNFISNNTLYNNYEMDLYMDWWYNDSIIQNNILYNDLPAGTKVLEEDRALEKPVEVEIDPVPIAVQYEEVCGNIFKNNLIYNKNFGNRIIDIKTKKPMDEYINTQTLNTFLSNIEADPMLEDPSHNKFNLNSSSPCINSGTSELAPAVDITGQNRVGIADIGAYEYRGEGEVTPIPVPDPTPTETPAPTVTPTPAPTPTPDVPAHEFTDAAGNWAYKAITAMADAGVIVGYNNGTVRPNANSTRAEFVTMVTRLMKPEFKTSTGFNDTSSTAWYAKALSAAVEKGWIVGGTDGSFRPDEGITREEAFVIISRVIDSLGVKAENSSSVLESFKDSTNISSWAKADVARLIKLGIIKGSENMVKPKAMITRAEICIILQRVMEGYLKK